MFPGLSTCTGLGLKNTTIYVTNDNYANYYSSDTPCLLPVPEFPIRYAADSQPVFYMEQLPGDLVSSGEDWGEAGTIK